MKNCKFNRVKFLLTPVHHFAFSCSICCFFFSHVIFIATLLVLQATVFCFFWMRLVWGSFEGKNKNICWSCQNKKNFDGKHANNENKFLLFVSFSSKFSLLVSFPRKTYCYPSLSVSFPWFVVLILVVTMFSIICC